MEEIVYRFLHPWVLAALPIPFVLLGWELLKRRRREPSVLYSDLSVARGLPLSMRQRALVFFPWTRALALGLGIVALARPQSGTVEYNVSTLGVDISMVLDVSGSMQDTDFRPSRLEAAKTAAIDFVRGRRTDRIGVVIFGSSAAILTPPTLDMAAVELFLSAIRDNIIMNNATALGEGLALGVRQIAGSEDEEELATSRVAILLTDGDNNSGKINPMQAAEIARSLGVRVYTIGIGGTRFGQGLSINRRSGFDEETLRDIADMTGGRYFHATNEESLQEIYREIDEMEKSEIEVDESADFDEQFLWFWIPGLGLLALEFLLKAFWIRRLP